ncbi:SufE family protein [Halochromatium glycolicum]|uniref:Fe-S metabolism protein SufE n=1 Tax=Halochromatium glycolicum TaxID=85075 RepID=A0AAJ0X9J1_9GAMM|nr:SufE family protein [Halochromatium glycolicum]MBK1704856.1 Fe-S metabolism protein SufE [Halochromatium glycolicum]
MADESIQDIVETFDLLGDWEQRYQYLVEIGERLPAMSPASKTEANRVMECMSTVYVAATNEDGVIRFEGDCDTAIIKGVVALLVGLFSGKTAVEIEETDVDALFEGLQLEEHLSPNRHVGVYAIVNKMKAQAASAA